MIEASGSGVEWSGVERRAGRRERVRWGRTAGVGVAEWGGFELLGLK